MNWREKLADWLTGGELSELRDEVVIASNALSDAWDALEEISAIPVTPESNGTLRKAVRIAREVINGTQT